MLNNLRDIYSVLWADLRNMRRHWKPTVASSLVLPFLYLAAFGYGLGRNTIIDGVSYLTFVIPGIVALTAFSTSFDGAAFKLQVDKIFYQSFDELLLSPVSLRSIVAGKSLIGVIRGLISSVSILIVGVIISPTIIIGPMLVIVLIVSCFVFALFGVLVALVTNSHQRMSTFNNLVILPMTFLCGTFFAISQMPNAAKAVLYALPLTHSSECLRASALGQSFPWLSLMALLVFGLAFFIGSIITLKKASV
jgi:ABC-2 type transport system permease protein